MQFSKKIRYFVIEKLIGFIFITISVLLFLSILSYNVNDPGFGSASNNSNIVNIGGILGAQIARFLIIFFSYTSYVFVLFFFINGIRLILGFKKGYILFKFLLLIMGILFLNLLFAFFSNKTTLIGDIFKNILSEHFNPTINSLTYWVFIFFIFILSLVLIFIAIDVSLKRFFKVIKLIIKIFFPLFGFLRLFKFILPTKKDPSLIKPRTKTKFFNRTEPTISKAKINNINKAKADRINTKKINEKYILPSLDLLKTSNDKIKTHKDIEKRNIEFSKKLETILEEFGVEGKIVNFKYGPVVTLYEFLPAPGIKTSKVVSLSDDIARAMSSLSTRISSQPGKTSIGIEIPNLKRENVLLGDLIKNEHFLSTSKGLTLALGKNIAGEKKFTDLEKMPHLLIAGTTGSGKSVGINSMIISLLYRFTPSECKLILIDPKMLELSIYEDIPHLLTPVVTNPNKAVFALKWVVKEMENRYKLMSSLNVKNIDSFNSKVIGAINSGRKLYREVQTGIDKDTRMPILEKKEILLQKMPLIVVVIDEMADLMMVAGKEVENLVQRLAQMARASGIHLIAATQRPSVDVITGTIKANFPSRISFRVASRFDSRTILNEMGAEQLLGSGDMLFLENGSNLTRLHGGFISEEEIEEIVKHIKSQSNHETPEDITIEESQNNETLDLDFTNKQVDELYDRALDIIIKQQKVSTSFVQRYLQIGYNRAARIIEKMEEDEYISEPNHSGKRSVLKKNK